MMVAVASQVFIIMLTIAHIHIRNPKQTSDAHFSFSHQTLIRKHQVDCILVSNSKENIKEI